MRGQEAISGRISARRQRSDRWRVATAGTIVWNTFGYCLEIRIRRSDFGWKSSGRECVAVEGRCFNQSSKIESGRAADSVKSLVALALREPAECPRSFLPYGETVQNWYFGSCRSTSEAAACYSGKAKTKMLFVLLGDNSSASRLRPLVASAPPVLTAMNCWPSTE